MRSILVPVTLFLAFSPLTGLSQGHDELSELELRVQETAQSFVKTLGSTLKSTIKTNGHEAAIEVCKTIAPNLANQISRETGWRVTRVSLKTRNPLLGTPDSWERAWLTEIANNPRPKNEQLMTMSLDQSEHLTTLRFMKALPTGELCLTCHGKPNDIPTNVASKLRKEYPNDRATGYSLGEIRGAISITATISHEAKH